MLQYGYQCSSHSLRSSSTTFRVVTAAEASPAAGAACAVEERRPERVRWGPTPTACIPSAARSCYHGCCPPARSGSTSPRRSGGRRGPRPGVRPRTAASAAHPCSSAAAAGAAPPDTCTGERQVEKDSRRHQILGGDRRKMGPASASVRRGSGSQTSGRGASDFLIASDARLEALSFLKIIFKSRMLEKLFPNLTHPSSVI